MARSPTISRSARAGGGFYFTDPGGSRTEPTGAVYYVNSQGHTGAWRARCAHRTDWSSIARVSIFYCRDRAEPDPAACNRGGEPEVFAKLPAREGHQAAPDGLAIDESGRLYVAHLGTGKVLVLDTTGRIVETLPGGNYDVSNLAFGGPGRGQLSSPAAWGIAVTPRGACFASISTACTGCPDEAWTVRAPVPLGVDQLHRSRQPECRRARAATGVGIDSTQMGVLLSAFFWTYSLMQPVAGWLVDRFDVYRVYAVGFALWSIAVAAAGLTHGFAALLATRLLLGIGESVAYPSYSRILASGVPEHKRGFANALIDVGTKAEPR